MKRIHSFASLSVAFFVALFTPAANAQDDLYYDPQTDRPASSTTVYDAPSNVTRPYNGDDYDDEYHYEDEDDYAYEYSSRIRRFHRRADVFDYYDPFYTDLYFYDPFFSPGASIYVANYNDYWRWRRWNRWNRFNHWNDWGWGNTFSFGYNNWCGWNNWGGGWNNAWGGWGSWNNACVYNNFFYDPYWTWNGFNPYYCPSNVWVNNNYYFNNVGDGHHNGGHTPRTYTGVRRHGTGINPGYERIPGNGRMTVAPTPQDHERTGSKSNGRTIVSDKEPATVERASRTPNTSDPAANIEARTPDNPARAARPDAPVTEPRRRAETLPSTEPRRSDPTTETRPSRRTDAPNEPTRTEPQPSRRAAPTTEPRPSRRSDWDNSSNNNSDSNRRTYDNSRSNDRPSRSNGSEARPSRSESSSPRSNSGGGGNSSGRSSGSSGRGGGRN